MSAATDRQIGSRRLEIESGSVAETEEVILEAILEATQEATMDATNDATNEARGQLLCLTRKMICSWWNF